MKRNTDDADVSSTHSAGATLIQQTTTPNEEKPRLNATTNTTNTVTNIKEVSFDSLDHRGAIELYFALISFAIHVGFL